MIGVVSIIIAIISVLISVVSLAVTLFNPIDNSVARTVSIILTISMIALVGFLIKLTLRIKKVADENAKLRNEELAAIIHSAPQKD